MKAKDKLNHVSTVINRYQEEMVKKTHVIILVINLIMQERCLMTMAIPCCVAAKVVGLSHVNILERERDVQQLDKLIFKYPDKWNW